MAITDDYTSNSTPAVTVHIGTVDRSGGDAQHDGAFSSKYSYDDDMGSSTHSVQVDSDTDVGVFLSICGTGAFSFPWTDGYSVYWNAGTWDLLRNGTGVDSGFNSASGTETFKLSHDGAGNVDFLINGASVNVYVDGSPLTGVVVSAGQGEVGSDPGFFYAPFTAADGGGGGGAPSYNLRRTGFGRSRMRARVR